MRLFFALQPAGATALAIGDWRDRQLACDGRAVPPANFHITLAFLGEIPATALPELCDSVDRHLDGQARCADSLNLNTLGYWARQGLLWLGPDEWPEQLEQLATGLRGATQRYGGKRDRSTFQPHITLFRRVVHAPAAPATPPGITFAYQGFSLFESRQRKSGVSYHDVCHWQF